MFPDETGSPALSRCGILGTMIREQEAPPAEESRVLARARAGDRAAFDQLVATHLSMVWRVVFRIVRHAEDAEDVTQEVFLAAWLGLGGFREQARFSTWLHQIAVTRSINHLERAAEKMRRAATPIDPTAEDTGITEVDVGPAWESERRRNSPLAALEAQELRRRLARCLDQLPTAWRTVLALRDAESLSYEEISRTLDTAIGTVRSRIARARMALRECISGAKP
jgi:RNA polymerase sigma-70 factor, ECF subfamily